MDQLDIEGSRFPDDTRLFEELYSDQAVRQRLGGLEVAAGLQPTRARLLGSAVRIDPRVTPHLAAAVSRLVEKVPGLGEIEAYVFNDADINAFVTEGRSRTIVVLSSGAVNTLVAEELEFVIGHELGHAAFKHLDINVNGLVADSGLTASTKMRLRAWQRAAEISADRAGLLCCGSVDHAASALFKVISGLRIDDLTVSPEEFAGQWQHLLDEVVDEGDRTHWQITHPFPPLRMRAMLLYWDARIPGKTEPFMETADREIARMLAMMDPGAAATGTRGDPLLGGFLFWGGLYIALASGNLTGEEADRLQETAPPGQDVTALTTAPGFDPESCVREFTEAVGSRRRKLSAVERHRIVYGLIDVGAADGTIDAVESTRLHKLAEVLGVSPSACDLMVQQYRRENENVG